LTTTTCDAKFDIDARFATDIIPRGWEVRQDRQSCWIVPNAKNDSYCGFSQFLIAREFGTSQRVIHGGFPPANRGGLTASPTIETEGMVYGHVSHHKDCVYDRRSGENLQG
jgi:hypothetical protein